MRLTFLKELFAAFVRSRGFGRHFAVSRCSTACRAPRSAAKSRRLSPRPWRRRPAARPTLLLKQLDSHPDGLSAAQAELIREQVGLNEVEQEKPLPWWLHLWHCYKNPSTCSSHCWQSFPTSPRT
jgi:Mg2+-importing ATPase